MYIKEFISQLEGFPIDENTVASIQERYRCSISNEVKKIVSFAPDGYFFDDDDLYRVLAVEEIIHAPEELHVDFIQKKILPVIDTGDNDFIVFDCDNNVWCKFNIVDEVRYRQANNISDLVQHLRRK